MTETNTTEGLVSQTACARALGVPRKRFARLVRQGKLRPSIIDDESGRGLFYVPGVRRLLDEACG